MTTDEIDCYGCEHCDHRDAVPDHPGTLLCYGYCGPCADDLAEAADESQAAWEQWKADGCPPAPPPSAAQQLWRLEAQMMLGVAPEQNRREDEVLALVEASGTRRFALGQEVTVAGASTGGGHTGPLRGRVTGFDGGTMFLADQGVVGPFYVVTIDAETHGHFLSGNTVWPESELEAVA